MTDAAILSVRDLSAGTSTRQLLKAVSFTLSRGRTLALIGESGAGKSLTALAIMGLLPPAISVAANSVLSFAGKPLPFADERGMRALRGRRMAIVFQDPMACLNPFMTVGAQIDEMLQRLGIAGRDERRRRIATLMAEVELPDPALTARRYPHELSGGQQQRVVIAMAIAGEPDLLIADEPTSALDASIEDEIVRLLSALQARHDMAMLFITHDLAIASALAHEVAVMREGEIVEIGTARRVMSAPRHAYSAQLIRARNTLRAARVSAGPGPTGRILALDGVSIDYRPRGLFSRPFRAVHDVSLVLQEGRTLGILGRSGSGKSTLGAAIVGLIGISEGRMTVLGREIAAGSCRHHGALGRECQLVFQNPYGALNPRLNVEQLMAEPLALSGAPRRDRGERIAAALAEVGLTQRHMTHYPHQLSGGQRQRVCIARALLCQPRLLVCDEVVSALDMTVQVQVLELLRSLQKAHGFGMVFIGHDIEVVRWISDDIAVMDGGRIADRFSRDDLYAPARHDLTKLLLRSRAERFAA